MINISYIRLLNAFESFSNAHLQIKRFASDFPEQVPNFGTEKENYPILFVSPNNTIFDENANQFTVDVYCFDIIEKDRININTILSDTNTILNDVYRWFKDGEIFGIDVITDTPTCTPINNGLLDYAAGWQMSITFVVDTYGICEIPFNESPVVITEVCDIVYSQYLTCETLADCQTIIDIQALLPTQDQKDAMDNANGPDASNPFATMADIGGGGTVTSVATAGLISGGPITSSGTITTSINTNKLVGRFTAGTGVMEEIIIGSGLTLTGAGTLTAGTGITELNGLTGAVQTFVNDTNVTITSSGTSHTLGWSGTLADNRIASASTWNNAGEWIKLTSALLAPADSTAYLMPNMATLAPAASTGARVWKFTKSGTVLNVNVAVSQSANGTSEAVTVYLRNTTTATDYLCGTFTMDGGVNANTFANFSTSIAINTTDLWAIKILTPAWVTNPTGVYFSVTIFNKS